MPPGSLLRWIRRHFVSTTDDRRPQSQSDLVSGQGHADVDRKSTAPTSSERFTSGSGCVVGCIPSRQLNGTPMYEKLQRKPEVVSKCELASSSCDDHVYEEINDVIGRSRHAIDRKPVADDVISSFRLPTHDRFERLLQQRGDVVGLRRSLTDVPQPPTSDDCRLNNCTNDVTQSPSRTNADVCCSNDCTSGYCALRRLAQNHPQTSRDFTYLLSGRPTTTTDVSGVERFIGASTCTSSQLVKLSVSRQPACEAASCSVHPSLGDVFTHCTSSDSASFSQSLQRHPSSSRLTRVSSALDGTNQATVETSAESVYVRYCPATEDVVNCGNSSVDSGCFDYSDRYLTTKDCSGTTTPTRPARDAEQQHYENLQSGTWSQTLARRRRRHVARRHRRRRGPSQRHTRQRTPVSVTDAATSITADDRQRHQCVKRNLGRRANAVFNCAEFKTLAVL